jgi:hypothetical protein
MDLNYKTAELLKDELLVSLVFMFLISHARREVTV